MRVHRVAALLALSLCALPAAAADLKGIQEKGVLRVLVSHDEEPGMFNFKAGEPGFERELVESFAKLHKLKVQVIPVERFSEIIGMLDRGEGDVITGIIENEARRKLVAFTVEVLPARHVVVTVKPRPPITTLEAFKKEKVGSVRGTSWAAVAVAAGIPQDALELFPDRPALVAALREGKITATVISLSDLTLMMRRDKDLQPGMFVGEALSAGWAVRKEDKALLAALDEYLDSVRKTQTWSRLVVKYFGEEALKVLKGASAK